MNLLRINEIKQKKNGITAAIITEGDKEFIETIDIRKKIRIEYDQDISIIPESIAVIPIVCNILPIVWLFDATLYINEIDRKFYESIEEFKKGFIEMYPYLKFAGNVRVNKIIENDHMNLRSAVLFSGGVDAFNTFITHIDEKPDLITVWGADIDIENQKGWKPVEEHLKITSEKYGVGFQIIRSNFRKYIQEGRLDKYLDNFHRNLGWWHDFQHGLALIGHTAPLAFVNGYGNIYIASSFTASDRGHYTCASDPTIDNFVRFGKAKVIHDGYEFNRQEKIHRICQFAKNNKVNVPLRVCWESKDGENCCSCEKCYRTIMGILAEKEDPRKYGFKSFDKHKRKKMMRQLKWKYFIKFLRNRYLYIQQSLRQNYTFSSCPKDIKWFYKMKIEDKYPKLLLIYIKIREKIERKMVQIFKSVVKR